MGVKDLMQKKNICPKCGGKIVAEATGSYGTVYYLRRDGTVGHKLRDIKYEHSGDVSYYCANCREFYDKKDVMNAFSS